MPGGRPGDDFLANLAHELPEHFDIGHATIQVEVEDEIACVLEPDQVV
jgi:cobalt-zinc-cadmium efflux system protein